MKKTEEVREMRLAEMKGLMHIIAAAMIVEHGEYRCTLDGQKMVVRK